MIRIHQSGGKVLTREAPQGAVLADLLGSACPEQPCGGKGRCGKCRVRASGMLSDASDEEREVLGDDAIRAGLRLACSARVEGDADVWVGGGLSEKILEDGVMPRIRIRPVFSGYGAAVDIGTTTLAGRLYDRDGRLVEREVSVNPQRSFGADVMTRIDRSMKGGRAELAACIRNAVDGLLGRMAGRAEVPKEQLDAVVLTGNTTMLYLFAERPADCLAFAPYEADERFGRYAEGGEAGLPSFPKAAVYFTRCISAFVGADTTCALLAGAIREGAAPALLADIGTNGEMALWDGEQLRCCSAPAGPVFEGAEISCGMPARPGAIDRVFLQDRRVVCRVIGDEKAQGICGSGLIDAVSVLRDLGVIDATGHMEEAAFSLTPEVSLSQKDIRNVQMAKSAVLSGIRTLLESALIRPEDVKRFAVAGGFGRFLDPRSAARIGLFPEKLAEKTEVLGNAALSGASMILLDRARMEDARRIADAARTVTLAGSETFAAYYMDGMYFPD